MGRTLLIVAGCLAALVGIIPEGQSRQASAGEDGIHLGDRNGSETECSDCLMITFLERETIIGADENSSKNHLHALYFVSRAFDIGPGNVQSCRNLNRLVREDDQSADFFEPEALVGSFCSKRVARFVWVGKSASHHNGLTVHMNGSGRRIAGVFQGISYIDNCLSSLESQSSEFGIDGYPGAMFGREVSIGSADRFICCPQHAASGPPQSACEDSHDDRRHGSNKITPAKDFLDAPDEVQIQIIQGAILLAVSFGLIAYLAFKP